MNLLPFAIKMWIFCTILMWQPVIFHKQSSFSARNLFSAGSGYQYLFSGYLTCFFFMPSQSSLSASSNNTFMVTKDWWTLKNWKLNNFAYNELFSEILFFLQKFIWKAFFFKKNQRNETKPIALTFFVKIKRSC